MTAIASGAVKTPVRLSAFSPAKINLYLHVGKVEPNGRHCLDSLVVFTGPEAADRLVLEVLERGSGIQLETDGPFAVSLQHEPAERNLAVRAISLLARALGRPLDCRLTLTKNLPVAAGLGGGSMNAAMALHLADTAFRLGFMPRDLEALGAALGGDVPACVRGRPVLMRGEGARLNEPDGPDLPELHAVILNSGISCPTGPVFGRFDARGGGRQPVDTTPPQARSLPELISSLETGYANDLQDAAIDLHPGIARDLDDMAALPGARCARLAGSGASVFALFETRDLARIAADRLRDTRPDAFVCATGLGTAGIDLEGSSD